MILSGRTAIVTGAARGIGAAIARKLSESGANMVLADIEESKLRDLAGELGGVAVAADISTEDGAAKVVDVAIEKFGSLEILVNNAGISRNAIILRMKAKDFDDVIRVNLRGTFLMSRAAVKQMIKVRYGKIVNIASVVSFNGNAGQASYAASKAGVISLTGTLAKELGVRGIRANAVAPGFIETDMTKDLPESAISGFLNRVILGNVPGSPNDVAETVLFLVSPASDYITGAVIPVDGGMLIA